MANIIKGTDVPLSTIIIYQDVADPTTTVSLASMNDYQIYVYSITNGVKKNYATFKKTPVGLDKPIIIVTPYTQGFIVDRQITNKVPDNTILYVEAVYEIPGAGYISSTQKIGNDGFQLATIVPSANPLAML
jgi:hypothetical protein